MTDLPNSELRRLKAAAQHLEPSVRLGKNGITGELLATLALALEQHELVKIRLEAFKDQKRALARELATRSGSRLVMEVGHVVVLFRRRPAPAAEAAKPVRLQPRRFDGGDPLRHDVSIVQTDRK